MKNNFLLIRKSYYKQLSQSALAVFAGDVFTRMSTDTKYQAYSDLVRTLGEEVTAYKNILEQSQDGARRNLVVKAALKKTILDLLDQIVLQLTSDHDGTELWAIDAGFSPLRIEKRQAKEIGRPYGLEIVPSTATGEVKIRFRTQSTARVYSNAVEYSYDEGATWHNGTYGSSRGIRITGLEPRREVLVRVRSLGSAGRVSDWSDVVRSYVF